MVFRVINQHAVLAEIEGFLDSLATTSQNKDVKAALEAAPRPLHRDRSFMKIAMDDCMQFLETVAAVARKEDYSFDNSRLPVGLYATLLKEREGKQIPAEKVIEKFSSAVEEKQKKDVQALIPDFMKILLNQRENKAIAAIAKNLEEQWTQFLQNAVFVHQPPDKGICYAVGEAFTTVLQKQNEALEQHPEIRFEYSNIANPDNSAQGVLGQLAENVKNEMQKSQQSYFLREKQKLLEKEQVETRKALKALGEEVEGDDDDLAAKVEKAGLPADVLAKAKKELKRLDRSMGSEAGNLETYIERLIEMPWNSATEVKNDIGYTEQILNADHYGLEKVKEQIVKQVAVQNRTGKNNKTIICLVGPPGVGKTSIARSIAAATGRKYVRMALGGVDDEAEIRGHRSTYIGAKPGRIIELLSKVGVKNPLFLLDEIDKLGSHATKGSPADALLEVLDAEQNNTFTDHYMDVEFDLSNVMWVCTANDENAIPAALKDRMHVIRLPGYTHEEKIEIASRYLIPKQMRETGLDENSFSLSQPALDQLVQQYTREAGVRSLERQIKNLCGEAVVYAQRNGGKKLDITPENLAEYAGPPRISEKSIPEVDTVGRGNGLYWSEAGGGILPLEAELQPGKEFALTISGSLKDVMKESAANARAWVRNLALTKRFNVEAKVEDVAVHVNAPEQATPKDGPSAGALFGATLVSVATGIPMRRDVAMTGELSLKGDVLPIGGLREKLDGARRDGAKVVLIPKANEKDLADVPEAIRNALKIIAVSREEEVIDLALVHEPDQDILKPRQPSEPFRLAI